MASAHRGQVVFAHFFGSRRLEPRSIVLLDGGPGTIIYNNSEKYSLVKGELDQTSFMHTLGTLPLPQVDRIQNLLDPYDTRLDWEVRDNAHISFFRVSMS